MHDMERGVALGCSGALAAFLVEAWRHDWLFSSALRAWWIDPAVATLSFAMAIAVFDRQERALGAKSREFMSSGSLMTLVFAGASYWAYVALWVWVVPPPGGRGTQLPDGVPTSLAELLYVLLEICSGVVAYDFLFFLIHLAMHTLEPLWGVHQLHHTIKRGIRARDVLLHSPMDGALQVTVNILVQRYTPWGAVKSRVARAVHNVIVTWMLTESHTSSPSPRIARRWFSGVRRHRAHHTVDSPYFQQFFGYLDNMRMLWLRQAKAVEC